MSMDSAMVMDSEPMGVADEGWNSGRVKTPSNLAKGKAEGKAKALRMMVPPRIRPRTIDEDKQDLRVTIGPDAEGVPEEEWDTCIASNSETGEKSRVEVRFAGHTGTKALTTSDCDRLNAGDEVDIAVRMPPNSGAKRGSRVEVIVTVWQIEFQNGGLTTSFVKESMLVK